MRSIPEQGADDGRRDVLTQRQARLLAWVVCGFGLALLVLTVTFVTAGWGQCAPQWRQLSTAGDRACGLLQERGDIGGAYESFAFGIMGALFAVLGAVLASRRKDNALGWIFLATGLVFLVNSAATVYTIRAAEAPGTLPVAAAAALVSEVFGGPIVFAPFALFFLLFPDGRVLSPRWRIVVWALGASVALQTVSLLFKAGPLRLTPLNDNPLGIAWLSGSVREVVEIPSFAVQMLTLVAAVASLVIRFRRSRGIERQQMKWFTTSSAFVGLTFLFAPLFWAIPQLEVLWGPLFLLATGSVPVAATMAILRYRLYDIDVLINRALVYGGLTGLLALTYLGLVVALQQVLSGVGGGSDVAVAGSTLAVAALFRPLRSRIQSFIDRRFYRRKYNARRTIEAFSATLRQETDISTLRVELLGAVQDTIEPVRAVVWLRGDQPA